MEPINQLDVLVARFRMRWETDAQYRARVSGVAGLATVVGLCSCMLIASLLANYFFGSVGFGSGGPGGVQQPNMGLANFIPTFPTDALPTWAVQATPPGQVVPNSKTPAPTPTRPGSKTPCTTTCGGVTYTASWSPTSWATCANGGTCVFSVHATASGVSVSAQITFCNGASITPPAGQTNSRGTWSYSFAGPGAGSRASADVSVQVQRGVAQDFHPTCV